MVIQNKVELEIRYIDDVMGYGVFICEDIEKGSIVETCYCLKTYNSHINPTTDYLFENVIDSNPNESVLALGYGSIYNHNDDPNVAWRKPFQGKPFIQFYALKDIKKGEELFINYGKKYWLVRKKKLL